MSAQSAESLWSFVGADVYPIGVCTEDGSIVVRRTTRDLPNGKAAYIAQIGEKNFSLVSAESRPAGKSEYWIYFQEAHVDGVAKKLELDALPDGRAVFRLVARAAIAIQRIRMGQKRHTICSALLNDKGQAVEVLDN